MEIWQQKKGPNMLRLCVGVLEAVRGWLMNKRCGCSVIGECKEGKKLRVNYRELDEITKY